MTPNQSRRSQPMAIPHSGVDVSRAAVVGSSSRGANFLRRLQRSAHGWEWLSETLDGCTEQWWLDCKEGLRLKRAIEGVGNERASVDARKDFSAKGTMG